MLPASGETISYGPSLVSELMGISGEDYSAIFSGEIETIRLAVKLNLNWLRMEGSTRAQLPSAAAKLGRVTGFSSSARRRSSAAW